MAKHAKPVILVADDEPSTRALVAGHLRAKGYKVIEAGDGDEAWELAHEHLPHAVVLDVMMPGMSGWEVCRKIREAVSLAHTGVVMLTGIGENLNELTSPLYGADAYVDKPFEFGELDQKLWETLVRRGTGAIGRPDGADQQDPTPSERAPKRAQPAEPSGEKKPAAAAKPRPTKTKAAPKKKPAARAKSAPLKPKRGASARAGGSKRNAATRTQPKAKRAAPARPAAKRRKVAKKPATLRQR